MRVLLICILSVGSFSQKYREKTNLRTEDLNIVKPNIEDSYCSFIPENERFDCYPEDGASELACGARNCCWKFSDQNNIPSCYYKIKWKIYNYENVSSSGNENDVSGFLKLNGRSTYKNDLPFLKIESTSVDNSILRVKVSI